MAKLKKKRSTIVYKKITITLPEQLDKSFRKILDKQGLYLSTRIAELINRDIKNFKRRGSK